MTEERAVWNSLPDDVVEKILVRLSVYDTVRAGCACKSLRSFISSSSRRLVSSSSPVTLLLLAQPLEALFPQDSFSHPPDPSAWAYDSSRQAWLKLSMAFLQPYLEDCSYPVASAGGLLCFGSGREFVVCNPITRSFRRIPILPYLVAMETGEALESAFDEHAEQAFGLMYESSTGTYELSIIHYLNTLSGLVLRMMRYSSVLSEWRAMSPFAMGSLFKLHSSTITACGSGLYTLWEKRRSLVVYGLCNGVWTEIESPECTSTLLRAYLMDVHGSLHMIGGVGSVWLHNEGWEYPTSVRIWKLHSERKEWMEVARMPSSVLQDFRRQIDFNMLRCWGKDGVVYMKSACSDVLMGGLARNEWKWLKDVEKEVYLEGFVFEGSLLASA